MSKDATGPARLEMYAALEFLQQLHSEVDRLAGEVAAQHGDRLKCMRGCSHCCVDGITVFDVEAERIRRAHPELLASGVAGLAGACAFLDGDGACRIYEDRPYVCRTQGLPLRWLEELDSGETVERRDICPLNEPGEPKLEELTVNDCWPIGPVEEQLARVQAMLQGAGPSDELTRVPLRDLFAKLRRP